MRLIKNRLECAINLGRDFEFIDEKAQVLFDDRRHFIEVNKFADQAGRAIFMVCLDETPNKPLAGEEDRVAWDKRKRLDVAYYDHFEDAMTCVIDTIS